MLVDIRYYTYCLNQYVILILLMFIYLSCYALIVAMYAGQAHKGDASQQLPVKTHAEDNKVSTVN